jgi:hypothetical protein
VKHGDPARPGAHAFDILAIGPALPLFFANLVAIGRAVALAVTAMILR